MKHERGSVGAEETAEFSRRVDDVGIKFPFGVEVKATGRSVILVLIAFAVIAVLVWHDYKSTEQNTRMVEALSVVSFVLTLTEHERKALHLEMPEALRRVTK